MTGVGDGCVVCTGHSFPPTFQVLQSETGIGPGKTIPFTEGRAAHMPHMAVRDQA